MNVRGAIVAYHAVDDCARSDDPGNLFVPIDAFASQMAYLSRRRNVVPLEDLVHGSVGRGKSAVAITFDDGYGSVIANAAPILARYNFPATVFVPTKFVGGRNTWVAPTPCRLDIMTAEELGEIQTLGVDVQSHGHAHIDFQDAGASEAREDLRVSISELERMVGRRPRFLAYPFGRSSAETRLVAAESGFEAAFSIERVHAGPYAIGRVQITPLDNERLFALKTTARYVSWRWSRIGSAAYGRLRPLARRALWRRGVA